jgi:hypothetical protein
MSALVLKNMDCCIIIKILFSHAYLDKEQLSVAIFVVYSTLKKILMIMVMINFNLEFLNLTECSYLHSNCNLHLFTLYTYRTCYKIHNNSRLSI